MEMINVASFKPFGFVPFTSTSGLTLLSFSYNCKVFFLVTYLIDIIDSQNSTANT